jgi:transcription initiation factor TFIID TATA-box-binding protein
MVEVVNIVSAGNINNKIELGSLLEDFRSTYVVYEPENFPALTVRFDENSPTTLIFKSGKYTITGASTYEELYETNQKLINTLQDFGVINEYDAHTTTNRIVNIVCTESLELDMDLAELMGVIGFENTEYEPEQSPFMIYRPEDYECVMTIASSGDTVINGVTDVDNAKEAVKNLRKKVNVTK